MIEINEAVEQLEFAVGNVNHLLIVDERYVSGGDGARGLVLVGMCLLEVENDCRNNTPGYSITGPMNLQVNRSPTELRNIQNAISVARDSNVRFVLCYHLDGDPHWHFEWSNGDCESAMAVVWQFVKHGMIP